MECEKYRGAGGREGGEKARRERLARDESTRHSTGDRWRDRRRIVIPCPAENNKRPGGPLLRQEGGNLARLE
jgi:hypothetical protein